VLLLALAGAVLSALLLQQHHGAGEGAAALCAEAGGGGCDVVNRSSWSAPAGVPVAAVGLLFYASLAALAALGLLAEPEPRRGLAALGLGLLGLALFVDLVLLGVQALAIGAWCRLCLATYALNAIGFALLWPERRAGPAATALPGFPAGRLALGAWALASIGGSLVAASLSVAFAAEGERRQATLLGAPVPAAPARPPQSDPPPATDATAEPEPEDAGEASASEAAPGDPVAEVARLQEELRLAHAEARRLRETLDDPQKLQQYHSDRSVSAFRQAESVALDLAGTPFKGPEQAPIRVVEFSDFLCPYCRNLAGALASYLPGSAGRVAVFFKHYPLDPACNESLRQGGHPGACQLALGGICAEKLGGFWQYHDRVFSEPPESPSPSNVADLAFASGLDRAAFQQCLADPATRRRLEADLAEGRRVGVTGTPAVFVNGKRLERIGDFVRIVDIEAERLGLAPAGN
jgi:protein-disulfide isomerase/uncharacterized membrane protein